MSEELNIAVSKVEGALRHFGLNPDDEKVEGQYKWRLTRGSAGLSVRIFDIGPDLHGVEVCSRIMDLPEDANERLRLYEKVMDMNDSLVGAWFSARSGDLYLIFNRGLEGLDTEEIIKMIDSVSYYADLHDDKLKEDFGCS